MKKDSVYDGDSEARDVLQVQRDVTGFDDAEETRRALAKTSESDDKKATSTRQMMQVWYADGTQSRPVNPNRPAGLLVFEAEFGHTQPDGIREVMWLVWHLLGRPGPNGGPHVTAVTDKEREQAFDDWFVTVEELDTVEQERGKAIA